MIKVVCRPYLFLMGISDDYSLWLSKLTITRHEFGDDACVFVLIEKNL